MPNKIIELLNKNEIELTDDLKSEIDKVWETETATGDNLFTQDELDDIIKKRLAREQKVYESEIKDLQDKLKGLIDPEKVQEYEEQVKNLKGQLDDIKKNTAKDYELKLAGTKNGVVDEEYFEFLIEKNKLKDRLVAQVNDDGQVEVFATDNEGNILTEDGKKLGPEALVNEFKESKPDLFSAKKPEKAGGGGGNPTPQNKFSSEELKEKTVDFVKQLGYKN